MLFSDAKSSEPRLTIPYLLQQLSVEYDSQEEGLKREMQLAGHTGFIGQKFVYDRNHQLCMNTMNWIDPANFGENILIYCIE